MVVAPLLLSAVRSLASSDATTETVWEVGSSECTLASLEKIKAPFEEYFGNRLGEIQDNAQIEMFFSSKQLR